MMSKNSKKVALVTGASSGIGAAIAERLVNAGYRVFGTSRRTTLVAGSHSFEMLSLDITSDESIDAAVNELVQQVGRIDVLVNSAGFNLAMAGAEESSIEQAQSIFNTNFWACSHDPCRLPVMRRQGHGRIINIGSVVGFLPMPYMALYSATKHAIKGYSQSLDHELRTMGIRVSVVEPAFMKTSIDANAQEADTKLDEYQVARVTMDKRSRTVRS